MGKSKSDAGCLFDTTAFASLALLLLVMITAVGVAGKAAAQQTDADFSAYCRANFNNSTYQRFAQSWGTEHACVQGGTRQGIDLAEACFLTTGSRNFEISGVRVLCEGSPDNAPLASENDLGEPDFNRYCNENFPNSVYERRAGPDGVNHYCRRPGATGGFTLQNVDLAMACRISQGTSNYRIEGARVFCTLEDAVSNGAGVPPSNGGDNAGPAPFPFPLPDPNGGPVPPPVPFPPPFPVPVPNPSTENPAGDDSYATAKTLACGVLGGSWHGGTLPLVDEIRANLAQELSQPCSGPADLCQSWYGQMAFAGYMKTLMVFQCHAAFFMFPEGETNDDINLAVKEACLIEPILNDLLVQVNSYGMSISPQHYLNVSKPDLDALCDCVPEIPDFTARVEALKQQAEQNLIEALSQ